MEACSQQWCRTSLQSNVSVLQEWVIEVSCHRLVDTCPITNASYATVLRKCGNCAQEKVNYAQYVYYAHYVVHN